MNAPSSETIRWDLVLDGAAQNEFWWRTRQLAGTRTRTFAVGVVKHAGLKMLVVALNSYAAYRSPLAAQRSARPIDKFDSDPAVSTSLVRGSGTVNGARRAAPKPPVFRVTVEPEWRSVRRRSKW